MSPPWHVATRAVEQARCHRGVFAKCPSLGRERNRGRRARAHFGRNYGTIVHACTIFTGRKTSGRARDHAVSLLLSPHPANATKRLRVSLAAARARLPRRRSARGARRGGRGRRPVRL